MSRWLRSVMGATSPATMPEPRPMEAPDPAEAGWGRSYRCRTCGCYMRGGLAAFDHHQIAHHEIELTHGAAFGIVPFACCAGTQKQEAKRANYQGD